MAWEWHRGLVNSISSKDGDRINCLIWILFGVNLWSDMFFFTHLSWINHAGALNIVSPWYDHMACHEKPTGAWGEISPIAWFFSVLDLRGANISPSLANSSSLLCVLVGIYSRQSIGVEGWLCKRPGCKPVLCKKDMCPMFPPSLAVRNHSFWTTQYSIVCLTDTQNVLVLFTALYAFTQKVEM